MAMAVKWSSSGNPRLFILFHDISSKNSWLHYSGSSRSEEIVEQYIDKVFFNAAVMTGLTLTPTNNFGPANQGFFIGFA